MIKHAYHSWSCSIYTTGTDTHGDNLNETHNSGITIDKDLHWKNDTPIKLLKFSQTHWEYSDWRKGRFLPAGKFKQYNPSAIYISNPWKSQYWRQLIFMWKKGIENNTNNAAMKVFDKVRERIKSQYMIDNSQHWSD